MKKLFVFDLDDTLVCTDSRVIVRHRDGKVTDLTPAEYAVYKAKPGDFMDFSNFDDLQQPRAILKYTQLLRKLVSSGAHVAILTARGKMYPISKFLELVGIKGGVKMMPVGSSDPAKKAEYIEKKIIEGYTEIEFFDDSLKNIQAVMKLTTTYPKVKLTTHHIIGACH